MARLRQTLTDYVVVAISPALIMALIGSLVFFLLEVFYHGEYQARLQYIFALFVFATVLIGRISIEEGASHAALFALPMGVVTALAMMRFVQFQGDISPFLHIVINLGLMGLVWFAAHELTYDCTVVDETLDASGAGLLDRKSPPASRVAAANGAATTHNAEAKPVSWDRWLLSLGNQILTWFDRPRKAHALGRWVVYFAVATLPLFGFGQLFIPATDVGRRRYIFLLLVVYVASALGLLLTTSFLSLRRYLRQRQLEMPLAMTSSWLLAGGILLVATIAVAAILPRPAAEYDVAKLPAISFGSPGQKQTSRLAQGGDGVEKKDESAQNTKHDPKADKTVSGKKGDEESKQGEESNSSGNQQQDQQGDKGASSDKSNNEDQSKTDSSSNEKQDNGASSNDSQPQTEQQQNTDESPSSSSQPSTPPPPAPSMSLPTSLGDWVRWLVFAVLVIGGMTLAVTYRRELVAALRQFWAELVAAWQRLFGGARTSRERTADAALLATKRPRRLADFHDPFATGMANRMSAAALVEYSFAALEAWAREHDCPRNEAQTASEFATQVARRSPALGAESQRLAEMYNMVAYGAATLSQRSNEHLRRLWQLMNSVAS